MGGPLHAGETGVERQELASRNLTGACAPTPVVVVVVGLAQMVRRFAAQLDDIFGSPSNPKPASSTLVKSHVINWGEQPWVRGAYT